MTITHEPTTSPLSPAELAVELEQEWANNPRWADVSRRYSAERKNTER